MAEASGCTIAIELDALPLSARSSPSAARTLTARLFAATGGDDYALLAALPPEIDPSTLSLPEGTTIARIGALAAGDPCISLASGGRPVEAAGDIGF